MEDSELLESIKKSVQIIALDNLCKLYNEFLEEDDLSEKEREYYTIVIQIAGDMLLEYSTDLVDNEQQKIQRPSWKK